MDGKDERPSERVVYVECIEAWRKIRGPAAV